MPNDVLQNEKLETLFALEFGQLLENYLYASAMKEQVTEIICSSLGLKSKQQLSQIFAGYDTPSTANIFELIRTLNDPNFTGGFLLLQTTLMGVNLDDAIPQTKTSQELSEGISEPTVPRSESCRYWENSTSLLSDGLLDTQQARSDDTEFGGAELNFDFLNLS